MSILSHFPRERKILDCAKLLDCYYPGYYLNMASIWKHPKSRYWTACFRDVNGHQRRASTRETNRKRAQRIADEYEKASRSKRTLKQVQTVLDRLHEELSGAGIVRTTVRSRVATWLETKKPETAPPHCTSTGTAWANFWIS
jgi:hypothetical protein